MNIITDTRLNVLKVHIGVRTFLNVHKLSYLTEALYQCAAMNMFTDKHKQSEGGDRQ